MKTQPSLVRYAPAAVLLIAVLADGIQSATTDLWMHVRFGQMVLSTHHLLRHDVFSYSAPGAPWFNHEWLADVVMALSYNFGGVIGLKLLKFLFALAIVSAMALGTAQTRARYVVQFGVLLASALALMLQVQLRPQLFDFLFLAALLAIFNQDLRHRRAPLWLAVPIMALWANLHGGFPTGAAVLVLYTAVVAFRDWTSRRRWWHAIRLGKYTTAALAATLINPFGIHAWTVALGKFKEPLIAMNLNVEFQGLFHHLIADGARTDLLTYALAILIALAGIVTYLMTPTADDLPLIAIAMMMTCGWLYAVRNMAFVVIAWSAPLSRHVDLMLTRWRERRTDEGDEPEPALPRATQLAMFAAAVTVAATCGLFTPNLPAYRDYPVGAVAFLERHGLHGNILTEYVWGGYVVWHQVPPSKIFFDSFDERYPASVQRAYVDFAVGENARADAMLTGYPHDFVLLPTGCKPSVMMSSREEWKLIYRDPTAALYARADSPAARTGVELHDSAPASLFP